MAILWTGTGGLFTRIGAMGGLLADLNTFQSSTLPTDVQAILTQYPANNDEIMVDGIETQLMSAQQSSGGIMASIQSYGYNTVNTMVYQDNPLLSNTNLATSLAEVIRQMIGDSQTIQACTIGSTVTAAAGNQGNGVCVVSTRRSDGLVQENAFQEHITVKCSSDSTISSSLAGRETFAVTGTVPYTSFDWRFPGGSGGSGSLSAIDATSDNSNGNKLTNSDFEAFTSNVPDDWSILVGSAGTTIKKSTSQFYTGAASLNFVGNGSELTSIAQTFGTGTPATLNSQTQYACSLWMKVDSVPAAGVLEVSLVDGSNTITTDVSGNQNKFSFTLIGATTSWANVSGSFRTPYILPSTLKIRVRLSTALSNTINLYIDHLALGTMTQVYTGGPSVSVFSGSSDFYVPDSFTAAITNNRGGASNNKTFQTLYDRMFGMRQLGLLLPSSGSPSISDSLITP